MTAEQYRALLDVDFGDVELGSLTDISKIRIDKEQLLEKRRQQYLKKVGNPYLVRVAGMGEVRLPALRFPVWRAASRGACLRRRPFCDAAYPCGQHPGGDCFPEGEGCLGSDVRDAKRGGRGTAGRAGDRGEGTGIEWPVGFRGVGAWRNPIIQPL